MYIYLIIQECGLKAGADAHAPAKIETDGKRQAAISNAALWNGQIYPLLRNTIRCVVRVRIRVRV